LSGDSKNTQNKAHAFLHST